MSTIIEWRFVGGGLNLDRIVTRVFRTEDDAHRWAARQNRPVKLAICDRQVRVNSIIPPTDKLRTFS